MINIESTVTKTGSKKTYNTKAKRELQMRESRKASKGDLSYSSQIILEGGQDHKISKRQCIVPQNPLQTSNPRTEIPKQGRTESVLPNFNG